MLFQSKNVPGALALVALLLLSVSGQAKEADSTPVLVVGANIVTMNAAQPSAEALVYQGERIVAVGREKDLRESLAGPYRTLSLPGKTLVPGFIETHDHLVLGSISYRLANVEPYGTPTLASALEVIARAQPNDEGWVLAFGADQTLYQEGRGPLRKDLDALYPDTPVLVFHLSGHGAFANSEALRRAGIDKNTPDPDGGYFEKDASGELTGYLSGQPAFFQVYSYPPPTVDTVMMAASTRAKAGVTTASEMGFMNPALLAMARDATSREDFPIRVVGALTINTPQFKAVAQDIAAYETERLNIPFAKTWTDGSPQGGTAYFSHGYHDPDFGGAGTQASQQSFNETLDLFYQVGLWPAVHANGDGAVDVALNAIQYAQEKHGRGKARPHLIHALYTRPEQIDRMVDLGVGVTFFPTHIYYWGDLHHTRTVGPQRSHRLSVMGEAFRAGIAPTMHNDAPVTRVNPIQNMWIAVNRISSSGRKLGPDQAITAEQALAAYTINAAHQFGMEAQAGSLEAGKLADFVVLDGNPLEVEPAAIRDISVVATVVGGKTVYSVEEP